ncbi:TonB-dependent receptor [Rhizorhabdus phycosphaerae]|uniref:TonB-dependent receptor n=1 Tax=Rhizorhabdus phycosphaerae TaxID=2711156 RepID=UPI0019D10227|nr:TonB-dependent receptor [Rhizorhabdus phycosphaerae]
MYRFGNSIVRGAVALALVTGGGLVGAGQALGQVQAPAQAVRSFDIPAGSLGSAIARLGRQAGVMVTADAALVRGRRTGGLHGSYTPEQALNALVASSGLVVRPDGKGGFSVTGSSLPARRPAPRASARADARRATDPSEARDPDLIVVYGARETSALASVASSVGVITATDLENGQIRTTQDSFRRLANVMDAAFTNSGFIIRGLSSEGFTPAGAPTGSLYVDGVLQTRYGARFGARNLWDTEQVEVYRGPQSTLSGRAATAGAIYIKTKDPTFGHEAELSALAGNRDFLGGAFVVNMPVVADQVAIRVSGSYQRQDTDVSYPRYRDYANLDDFRTELSGTIRAKLLLTPSAMPDTRVLLTYAYSHDRPNERLIFENSAFTLKDRRGDGYNYSGILLDTFAEFRGIKVHNAGLEITHDLSDALRLTSQSSYTHGTTTRRSVDAGEPGVPDGMRGTVVDQLLSQELRLNYKGERWTWVAGLFGSHQKFDSDLSLISTPFFTNLDEIFVRKTNNLALFGEATFEVVPTWHLTVGGRLDYLEEETTEVSDSIFVGAPQLFSNFSKFDETNAVPRIGIAKDLSDRQRLGFTYSQGFRTGGYYLDRDTGKNVYYDPESVRNYELFYKGRLLGGRMTLNANLFYTEYDDQQVEIAPDSSRPGYTVTANAASSRSWGLEIEPTLRVNRDLSLFASVGYLDTRFKSFNTAAFGDLSGEQFPDAPEWSLAFGGRYEFLGGLFVGGDAKYTSSYNAQLGEGRPDRIGSRVLVNAQMGYRQERWEITVFAENLLNKRYLTFADRDAASVYGQAGPRRTLGINAKARF